LFEGGVEPFEIGGSFFEIVVREENVVPLYKREIIGVFEIEIGGMQSLKRAEISVALGKR
jgi:hypothetical protein